MRRRIAIICGGDSSEYEVSMRSAEGLYSFFDKERYEVYIVELKRNKGLVHVGEELCPIDLNDFSFSLGEQRYTFDYAYITIHGAPGENGMLQGYLEMLRLPYSTSSVLIEALTFDKYVLNNYLRAFGFTIGRSLLLRADEALPTDEEIVEKIGLPCFVKPTADGSSYGVSKVKELSSLRAAIDYAFKQCDEIMIEEFLDGIELAQGVYSRKGEIVVLPITEVVPKNEFFDYDAKYNGQVEEITPARLSEEVSQRVSRITEEVYRLLHCRGIIRVDYILTRSGDDLQINILEINTTPGMTLTSFIPQQVRAAGMDIKEVLADVVESAFE